MPQEFMVLRCFDCQMYQVHQVRKSKQWKCKMCGQKQSQLKIFIKGDAKMCRHFVQGINMKKSEENEEVVEDNYTDDFAEEPGVEREQITWEKFETVEQCGSSSSEDDSSITTDSDKWHGNKNKRKKVASSTKRNKILRPNVKKSNANTVTTNTQNTNLENEIFHEKIKSKPEFLIPQNLVIANEENVNPQTTNIRTQSNMAQQQPSSSFGKWAQYHSAAVLSSSDSES